MKTQGFEVDKRQIVLPESLGSLGEFPVTIKVFRDITAEVKVHIEKEASLYKTANLCTGHTARPGVPLFFRQKIFLLLIQFPFVPTEHWIIPTTTTTIRLSG